MAKKLNTRAVAAQLSWQIIDKGQSLDAAINNFFETNTYSLQDRGFIQELVYGVCRWFGELDSVSKTLLRSPIRNKDRIVHFVLMVGLYQLRHLQTADHAAVGETVSACKQLNKQWAKNLINGCLRNYLRDGCELKQIDELSHPEWIRNAIKQSWPDHCNAIFKTNNERPPMCIRVNTRHCSRDEYLSQLARADIAAAKDPNAADGIILNTPCAVTALPDFDQGSCSVQDTAAQISADLLAAQMNMKVLDACAAPGGKTAHLLERADNQLLMHALDISERRCDQLHSTLSRLKLNAEVMVADASATPSWEVPTDGYDRILVDAPCSGLGVIRRHPDIKHHRRADDIEALGKVQTALLDQLWKLLKVDGRLLYMTCSILPLENDKQIDAFLARTNDAMLVKTTHPNALSLENGLQTLPGVHGMDGFYYCLLQKK